MKMPSNIPNSIVAPCGMNCLVCYVHLKSKNACPGCQSNSNLKPNHCRRCEIKGCNTQKGYKSCSQCPTMPCVLIKKLDKSYRQRYIVSLIDNLQRIKSDGIPSFLEKDQKYWICQDCGGIISLHDGFCSDCKKIWYNLPKK